MDSETASQTYYACLLFYIGCTADAEIVAELFPDDDALIKHFTPVMFGSRPELVVGLMRAVAAPGSAPLARGFQAARKVPRAVREQRRHLAALCEVGQMLAERLGLPSAVQSLFAFLPERFLVRSPFLAPFGTLAGSHHERLDGSGYHRGATAAALSGPARLLAFGRGSSAHRSGGNRYLVVAGPLRRPAVKVIY